MNSDRTTGTAGLLPDSEPNWWRGAVIYQVYPRSYQDSNDDGIGDLKGIARRLPHIASIGADAVWISPFFKSPMKDFGYDVSDYRAIAPEFGTFADFQQLVASAHALNLRVIIDLVISHTSDQHPWFIESRSSRTNKRSDWYVWSDPLPDGSPPTNWLSVFGGPAWQWDGVRGQYYLHNFLDSQPDLNFHNPEVRAELLDLAEFWLNVGVDGFRLDTVNFYSHDEQLRNNPPLPDELRNATIAPMVNPYNHQFHEYDKNRPETIAFIEDLRARMDQFSGSFAVGEVGDAQRGLEIAADYTAGDNRLHSCYSFEFLSGDRVDAQRVARILHRFQELGANSWATWAVSNHDVVRHGSRWSMDCRGLRLIAALLMCLRGTVCIYQGEELGLTEAEIAYDDLRDPYGIAFWPKYRGRDGCRTPMVWERGQPNGDFSEANPWLPVPEEHLKLAVSEQENRLDSMLNHYRGLVRLRKSRPALLTGDIADIRIEGGAVSFTRSSADDKVHCCFNLADEEATCHLPEGRWRSLHGNRINHDAENGYSRLKGWEYMIATRC